MNFTATPATRTMRNGHRFEVLEVTFENHEGNMFLIRENFRTMDFNSPTGVRENDRVWFRACGRCSGYGHYSWCRENSTFCFDCNGSGLGERTTEADAAKLVRSRIAAKKRAEKKAFAEAWDKAIEWDAFLAENAEIVKWLAGKEERRGFIGDMATKVAALDTLSPKMLEVLDRIMAEDAEEAAKQETAGHFGTEKVRARGVKVTVTMTKEIETAFGLSTLVLMETEEGHALKLFGSGAFANTAESGKTYEVDFTVKEHAEYQGKRQTVVTRVAITKKK